MSGGINIIGVVSGLFRMSISGRISDDMPGIIIDILRTTRSLRCLEIIIDSNGGDMVAAFNIYDILIDWKRSNAGRITMIAMHECMSAATIIFMAGDVRRGMPHTSFLIHEPRGISDEMNADMIEKHAVRMISYLQLSVALYSDVGGKKSPAELVAIMACEKICSAEEFLDLGIVTHIV